MSPFARVFFRLIKTEPQMREFKEVPKHLRDDVAKLLKEEGLEHLAILD